MTQTDTIILDRVVLVKVEARIYGARKKLKKEDLVLADGSKLPPDDLASLGSKRLLDPEQLAVFNRLKKEAERICLRISTRFLGGFVIPSESATAITTELERIAQDFAAAKAGFLAGYDAAVTDWVVRHPEFAGIIEKAVDSVDYVSTRLAFDFLVLTVGLPEVLPPEEVVLIESKISRSISEQLFYEISVDANQLIEQSLLGKDQVTRSALRPIRRMRDKLDGLGFLDYRVAPVVSTIDELLERIPNTGPIEGSLLQAILATAMLLADPDKTRRHGEGLLTAQTMPIEAIVEDAVVDWPVVAPVAKSAIPIVAQAQLAQSSDDKQTLVDIQDPSEPSDGFSDLFDGIFDDDVELQDETNNGVADALITQSNALTQHPTVTPCKPAIETKLEEATTEEAIETTEATADQDYWF